MARELPGLPEEFIPKFEDDFERKARLTKRKKTQEERKNKSIDFIPQLRDHFKELSELMKRDLQERRLLGIPDYINYRINN